MVCYKCIYCQQKFIYKGNYTSHNKNIDKCKNKFEEQIEKYKTYSIKMLMDNYYNLTVNESRYKCVYCMKNFTSSNGLKYHYKYTTCSEKNNLLIKPNNTTSNITNNIINNNTNNGIINNGTINITNINLTPYDKIRYDEIELDLLTELFNVPGMALPKLTHFIFFVPANKENHVIFCPRRVNFRKKLKLFPKMS